METKNISLFIADWIDRNCGFEHFARFPWQKEMILGYTYVVVLLLSSENAARLTEVKTCYKHSPGGMGGLDRIPFQPNPKI